MSVWVDGRLVPAGEPALRPDDHGVVVGDGVFETVKVVGGRPFALTRHLARLRRSAHGLGLRVDLDAVRAAVTDVLAADREAAGSDAAGTDAAAVSRLRITVTGGPSPYSSDRGHAPPTLIIATSPASTWPETAAVATVPWARNERSAVAGLKTTSYVENVVALARRTALARQRRSSPTPMASCARAPAPTCSWASTAGWSRRR